MQISTTGVSEGYKELKEVFHLVFIGAAHFDRGAVIQGQVKLTVHVRADLNHAVQVDDGAAVHPLETGRVQLLLQLLHGDTHHVGCAVGVNTHVIAGGIDPVDSLHGDQGGFAAILDG